MASKKNPRQPRNLYALAIIVKCKAGPMADRRTGRRRDRGADRRAALQEAS